MKSRSISITAAFVIIIGFLSVYGGLQLPFNYAGSIGPAWLPIVIGSLLTVSAIFYWFSEQKSDEPIEWTDRAGWLTILGIFVLLVVFVALVYYVHLAVAILVFLFLFLSLVSDYSILKRTIVSVSSAVLIYVLFVVILQLPLPGT